MRSATPRLVTEVGALLLAKALTDNVLIGWIRAAPYPRRDGDDLQ
jgi:hypothetical protein